MSSEKQLLSLINAAQVLTSTLDLNKVLDQLITEVLQVIAGADAGVFFKYEPKFDKLIAENAIGYNMDFLGKIQLSPNEAMTGKTFTSKQATIFDSKMDTEKNMLNLYPEHMDYYEKSLGKLMFPASAICAPLLTKEDSCIGILTIVSFNEAVRFTTRDLQLLETFARQAVIAIENARLFSQTERAQKIISELSQVSLSQKGLPDITVTLSRLVGKDICVFDEFSDLICSSSAEAQSNVQMVKQIAPDFFKENVTERHVIHSIKVDGICQSIYFFPIHANDSQIGLLTVFTPNNEDLDPLDLFAIEQANMIFALEITNQERFISEHFKYEGYLLEKLTQSRFADISPKQRLKMGILKNNHYISAYIQLIDPFTSFENLSVKKQQFSRLFYRHIQSFDHKVLVLEDNFEISLLFIAPQKMDEKEWLNAIQSFLEELLTQSHQRSLFDFYAGIGSVFSSIEQITQSLQDAKSCVQYLQTSHGKESIMSYKKLGLYRLFLAHSREELGYYVEQTAGRLIAYDAEQGTELVQTLKIYLECNQNITRAAEESFVHLNTIKYRLQTAKKLLNKQELTGKDLFELQLGIYMHEYLSTL
ncbi:sugar diacid utilization regulator/GAF domain-containing protein [Bacillus ectoiniformans]|uniref:GAF domain-containing protein n=1 Tax=Bacillus ectoiniformans TaxID=1494429 RepID=UPI00195BDCA8|nr:GAF domain-containing protein [Bacillus ectoiniformans]MBM7649597.1 sugar diacid utilization regulator/GAF domain-containing protein [Bacillus ectoiniformans]